jgi:general secretion pathway protein C
MYRTDLIYKYPKLLAALNVLIALSLMIVALFFAKDILSSSFKKTEKAPPQSPPGVQKARKGLQDYSGVLRNNPFGFQGGQLRELSVVREGGVSRSDLTLIGTIAGLPVHSYAIFMDKSGRQEVFKVGESVFGAGKLKRVEKDRAVITESGREVKIPIAEMLTIKEINPRESGAPGSDFARSAGRGTFIVDQKKVLNALENPNQLMTDARLQPNITDGRQEGFILREVRGGGIYQSLGLQNGDVLLRINDYNISNPENALQAFTALRGMDRVQVDLLRNGSRMTMTYQIR